tara:strand:- start:51 stop:539 length:489 start_codon:yes stop_codon:yes gene_type:complete
MMVDEERKFTTQDIENEYMRCSTCNGDGYLPEFRNSGRDPSAPWNKEIACLTCGGNGYHADELRHPEHTDMDDLDEYRKVVGHLVADEKHHPDSMMGQAQDKFGLDMGKPQGEPIMIQTTPTGEPTFAFTPFSRFALPKNPASDIFRRGNPMTLAWRLLKHG